MPTLTRENAKLHCRTCLVKLGSKDGEHDSNASSVSLDEEMQEFKDIYINIATNTELQQLIVKYVDERIGENILEYPHHMCLGCYNKMQSFEKFRKRATESSLKLHAVYNSSGVTKVEIDYEDLGGSETRVINNDDDIYKLLLKDTLMETESVLLDSSAVATLASVEMHDPDPFDSTPPTKNINISASDFNADEEEIGYDWQQDLKDADSSASSTPLNSDDDSDTESDHVNKSSTEKRKSATTDTESEAALKVSLPTHKLTLRRRSSRNKAPSDNNGIENTGVEKKKRRTKKEMEEWRLSQGEKIESDDCTKKLKRRNKGTKNSFKCTQCNHCFAHKITLDAHVRKVHEGSKRPFQCDRCDKSYTFIGGLYTHIKEIHETDVRSYNCDYTGCDRVYTSSIAMQKHKRVKHSSDGSGQQKKYVCEQCGATFNQTGNLKYHRRTKHPTEAEQAESEKEKVRYECNLCQKIFHSRYTLKYHTLQTHTNDMKYECTICGRRMAKKFMLVQHMLVHSTDKMPCEHCGKQFIRKFELEAHIRAVHMKLKPFECQYCTECFASRKTLRHHEYIHTGEKPYVCDICGQAYRQQTCLKNHRKSHEKLSAEALLAANINRTMNTFLGGPAVINSIPGAAVDDVYK